MDGKPPIAVAGGGFNEVFGLTDAADPTAGYGLADWQVGKLPDAPFVARLIAEPGRIAAVATPQSGIGADILLTPILRMALAEGAFRYDLAETCRRFLSERVLFHPGPPPRPLLSVGALALLFTSQPAQLQLLSPQGQKRLRSAAAGLIGPSKPLGHWDEWLVRRMAEAPGWALPDGLASLRWVAWQNGDPLPEPASAQGLPPNWPTLLSLEP